MYHIPQIEETAEFKKFLNMSKEEFDKYMCQTYPNQFTERHLPMNQTCMCWGFDIEKGWYYHFNEMCQQLDLIEKSTGIGVIFTQIKEKFASGRFHNNILNRSKNEEYNFKIWSEIIDNIISDYEDFVGHICEETGKYIEKPIVVNNWYCALTEDAFEKLHPDRKDGLEKYKKYKNQQEKIKDLIEKLDSDQTNNLIQHLENTVISDLKESSAKAEELIDIDELDTKQ